MSHLEQRIKYQQARRERELDAMRTAYRLKVEAEIHAKEERRAQLIILAERRHAVEAERQARAEAELRARFADGTIQETALTFGEVKVFNPCGRAEVMQDNLRHHGIHWNDTHKVNLQTAIDSGATY